MSNSSRRSYKLDITTSTLTVSASFADAMNDPTSKEYQLVRQFKHDFPRLQIVRKTHKTPSRYHNKDGSITTRDKRKGLSYERILEMGFDANCDFKKLRNYLFFLLGEDEYCWLPDEPMEKYMRSKGFYLSRQTITKYREHLERLNYIHGGDFIYYRVYRDDRDRQCYQQVEKEEYNKVWRVYWDMRNDGADSELAFACMYSAFGGVPRKQAKPIKNAFHLKELNYLLDLVSTSIYNEASIQPRC